MPGQCVGAVTVRHRLRGAGAHVGAALFLGHRHTRGDAGLGGGHLEFGVVHAAGQQRFVDGGEFGIEAQRGHDGVGHRDRADVPRLRCPHRRLGGADDVGAGTVVRPGRGVQTVCDRGAHQLVVGGVELDLVDAVTDAVVGVQHGAVAVGELTPALSLRASRERAQRGDLVEAPLPAFANQRLDEHRRGGRVVVLERRDLVGDDVRVGHTGSVTPTATVAQDL